MYLAKLLRDCARNYRTAFERLEHPRNLFFVVLGLSAAMWGGWLERAGPRKAGLVAAIRWCGGLLISAVGVIIHQLWMLWIGSGVIGGIGLGIGYISPISTLVKWCPDTPAAARNRILGTRADRFTRRV